MSDSLVMVDKAEGITTLTLNRPDQLNALSRALRAELAEAVHAASSDSQTGVLILTGAGRAFSAGVDLKELGGEIHSELDDEEHAAAAALGGGDVVGAMEACTCPIIGAINGFAITGGFEVALACDVLIASTEARFADTHARVGILPGWGLSQKLSRAIGIYRAKEVSLTGNYVSAKQAEAWGLVNRVVAPADLMPTCRALAGDMLSCPEDALRDYKRVIDEGFATTFGEGLALEKRASDEQIRTVTADSIAARRADIQNRGRKQN